MDVKNIFCHQTISKWSNLLLQKKNKKQKKKKNKKKNKKTTEHKIHVEYEKWNVKVKQYN